MGEGRHTKQVAAPRSLPEIRAELLEAQRSHDSARTVALMAELRHAADAATMNAGGLRANV